MPSPTTRRADHEASRDEHQRPAGAAQPHRRQPAGPKTFSTRGKLVARIESIAAAKKIDLNSLERPEKAKEGGAPPHRPDAEATVAAKQSEVGKAAYRGKGVGVLARELLMDPVGYPYSVIADKVNERISGARAFAQALEERLAALPAGRLRARQTASRRK